MGVYNLLLGIGLAWTAVGDATIVSSLATFFGIWLLGAAAAALYTRVVKACVLQRVTRAVAAPCISLGVKQDQSERCAPKKDIVRSFDRARAFVLSGSLPIKPCPAPG